MQSVVEMTRPTASQMSYSRGGALRKRFLRRPCSDSPTGGGLSLDNFYRNRPYTIRQLLQHTAGLNTYGGQPYRAAVAAGDPVWPVAELLARVKADRLIFEPGAGWAYSNVGYLFVRQLIEETVAGVRCELYQVADCRQR